MDTHKQELNTKKAAEIITDNKLHVWEKLDVLKKEFYTDAGGAKANCKAATELVEGYKKDITKKRMLYRYKWLFPTSTYARDILYKNNNYFRFFDGKIFKWSYSAFLDWVQGKKNWHKLEEFYRYEFVRPLLKDWQKDNAKKIADYAKKMRQYEETAKKNADFNKKFGFPLYRGVFAMFNDNSDFGTFAEFANDKDIRIFKIKNYVVYIQRSENKTYPYSGRFKSYPKIEKYTNIRICKSNGKEIARDCIDGHKFSDICRRLYYRLKNEDSNIKCDCKSVQTDINFNVTFIKKDKKGMKFYKLDLLGECAGYAVMYQGTTYHAATMAELKEGIAKKIVEIQKKKSGENVWTKDALHNRFGFCFAGIREFCERVGIDAEQQYTVKELKEAAKAAGLDANYKYYRELHRINVL